ncbi:hypothetical protein E2C01_003069 [Portunus trituberculatus]|uniref:Uncharacterized protein n=1 Tax=Portunus trituberculatus TaxID=210409 RepID=A0A5B7CSI3_PORTR|nr:hypothetical protein [Portunus trituberculatus]
MEATDGVRVLGTQSAKKQHGYKSVTSFRRSHQRRSCAPNFTNAGYRSPWSTNTTANEGYRSDKTNNMYSSTTKFPVSQGDNSENVLGDSGIPKLTFESRFKRRSSLLKRKGDLKTKIQDDTAENSSKSRDEHKRILEDEEEEANVVSFRSNSFRVEKDNQEEPASEKKTEQKSRFVVAEGRRRLSGTRRRSMLDFAQRRALVSQSSVERASVSGESDRAPSGQEPGNSVGRSRFSHRLPLGSLRRTSQQKDLPVTNKTERKKQQECRRMLAFESGDEGDDSEDQTVPLSMLAQTPIMNKASVLQNCGDQKQENKVCEPIIKKSLLDGGVQTSRFRRRSILTRQQPEDNSAPSHPNMEQQVSRLAPLITNKSVNPSSEALLWHRTQPGNHDAPSCSLQEPTTYNCSSISTVKNINILEPPRSTRRAQRRRSAAVLCVRTPMKRKSMNLEPKSTSKLIGSSVSSKTSSVRELKKHLKSRRSLVIGTQLPLQPQSVSKVTPSNSECLHEEKTMQDTVTSVKFSKVDASTNTTINFDKTKLINFKVIDDIEKLLKEQEKLNAEAVLIQDKTNARRLEMKQKKLMESFATSISPLKRLKAMFLEDQQEESEVKESSQQDQAEGESGACEDDVATQELHCPLDESGAEWVSPKMPLDIRNHQIQWRRRQQDKRLTRTFHEPSIKEEEFAEPYQGDTSPFTILVGDCERPSLAPMTPHSRRNVGMLKLSLKEQLEQLYNN